MTWAVTAEAERFDEAAEWFRSKFPVTPAIADRLGDYAGPRAWTVAGVAQLDVVLEVYASLVDAIENGTPFEEWQKGIEAKLTEAWGRRDSARVQTIFRNATSQAFNAGRWRQMNEPAIAALRPYVQFDGIEDARQSDICRERDGTIVPLGDPWLERNSPQLHHRCRSQLRSLSQREALRRGVGKKHTTTEASEGFGRPATEADWKPDPARYPRDLFDEYKLKRGELERQTRRARLDGK